ncbi:hypothetical protein MKK75_27060, partial [Methylobacterium sp. J-030]|uniref:hypothetical protein n=1 Tax=Methylobacterium sp. J-030 TaxID=2836627 RepID=UPI001FBAF26B
CVDSTGASAQKTGGALAWAVSNGNAAGGFQGGTTLPGASTLFMFLIWGTAGVAPFASASLSLTLPSGYAYARPLFPFTTDTSGNPIPFTAVEIAGGALECTLATFVMDANPMTVTATRQLLLTSLPVGLSLEWRGAAEFAISSAPSSQLAVIFGSPADPDVPPGNTFTGPVSQEPSALPLPDIFGSVGGGVYSINIQSKRRFTDALGRVAVRANQSYGGFYVVTTGWVFGRRI